MSKRVPNPGSKEALDMGCECPVLDNARGRGYMGVEGIFVMTESCPLHGSGSKWEFTPPQPLSPAITEG